jgi:RNA polymerase sigma-70 factor (ECF subfamily)
MVALILSDNAMSAEAETESWAPTRQSLLSRLRDCEDQESWRDFFDTYWRLIYKAARESGLNESQAQEVVQMTFIYLTRRMPRFRYDRTRGSFKAWLLRVTRSRISILRRGPASREVSFTEFDPDADEANAWESIPDSSGDALEEIWQREWEQNIIQAALRRIRVKASARQLLIFEMAALRGVPLHQVARMLEVSLMQVYLARHRVGKLFKAEVERLRQATE